MKQDLGKKLIHRSPLLATTPSTRGTKPQPTEQVLEQHSIHAGTMSKTDGSNGHQIHGKGTCHRSHTDNKYKVQENKTDCMVNQPFNQWLILTSATLAIEDFSRFENGAASHCTNAGLLHCNPQPHSGVSKLLKQAEITPISGILPDVSSQRPW
jgi:hypothetical protein